MGTICSGHYAFGRAYYENTSRDNSINYDKIYSEKKAIAEHKQVFEALQFDEKNVGRLKKLFNRVDKDLSGTVEFIGTSSQ